MSKLLALLLFLSLVLSSHVLANQQSYSFKMGLGLNGKTKGQIKYFELRNESTAFFMIKDAIAMGIWSDQDYSTGRRSSSFASYQIGVKPESHNFYIKAYGGVGLISNPDSQLGGPFQFCETVGFGFQDSDSFVGLSYDHKSSAGIYNINKGRDFISAEMGIKF